MATAKTSVVKQKATALQTSSFSEEMDLLRSRLAAPAGDRIKFENQHFILPSEAKAKTLDMVIVDFVYQNIMYENAYQKGVAPIIKCFGLSVTPTGMNPSPNAPDMQNTDGCDGCPQNQFGSRGDGKACANRVLVAVVPADDANGPMYVLDLPPTSNLKKDRMSFNNYVSGIANGIQRPPYGVVTHAQFDPTQTYAKIQFDLVRAFEMDEAEDAEYVQIIRGRREEARARLMTEPDVSAAANDVAPKKGALKAPVKRRA